MSVLSNHATSSISINTGGYQDSYPAAFKASFFQRPQLPAPVPSAIEYVVIIVKENRTFDEVFGDDAEVSVDGHHWLVGSYPNAWTESTLMASYGGQKDFRFPTTAGCCLPRVIRGRRRLGARPSAHRSTLPHQRPHAGPALPQHLAQLPELQHEH
ncbi:MAG: hypothetical protein JJE04_04175, partial [Acidobacteriia bacterium]|nr:hypothetical protein [Terriglobia bacterium]